MKKPFIILAAVILTANAFAQAPEKMSYQGVIRNSSDQLVTNQQVGMQISILQATSDGTAVYVETQTPTTNANGLVSIEIGGNNATVQSGDFTTIDWANGPYYIKTETDPEGGTNYSISGTSQILSVPYAKYAEKAGNTFSGSYNDLADIPVNIDVNSTNDVTTSGNQTISGNKTFTNTIATDSISITRKTSKWVFSHHNVKVHPSAASYLTMTYSETASYVETSSTGERVVMIAFDLPYQLLGCPQQLKSVTLNYSCGSSDVYISRLRLRKSSMGNLEAVVSGEEDLTSTTADSYTLTPANYKKPLDERTLYLDIFIQFDATGSSNKLYLYEFVVETE